MSTDISSAAPPVFDGVVALDGPSGTGKSTVARRLALQLGARYLDTGAMYRAATVAVLTRGASLTHPAEISMVVAGADIQISTDPGGIEVRLDGRVINTEIRSAEVTAAVSAVSAVAAVRTQLVAAQRTLIGAGGIVVEGRDIGTVVWPNARPKIYLTADARVRADRRAAQIGTSELAAVAAGLARRDRLDGSRATSPLVPAADAIELDTTELSIDDVVQRLVELTMAGSGHG